MTEVITDDGEIDPGLQQRNSTTVAEEVGMKRAAWNRLRPSHAR
jgi:hypothetical protein